MPTIRLSTKFSNPPIICRSVSLLSLFSPLGCHQASDNEDQARDTINQFAAIEDVYVSQCFISPNLPRSPKHIRLAYIAG